MEKLICITCDKATDSMTDECMSCKDKRKKREKLDITVTFSSLFLAVGIITSVFLHT